MKVAILAGGAGSRLAEETQIRPKPLVEIGGKPILWHIMKIYSQYGFHEFIILLGYKGFMIKKYFADYFVHQSDVTIDLSTNTTKIHQTSSEPWVVTLLDTGIDSMTGGRILRAKPYVGNETFMLTYGDGIADVNIPELLKFHRSHGRAATVTTVQPEGRYGTIDADRGGRIEKFLEKPLGDGVWINGGFLVCEAQVFDYLKDGDATVFERAPLEALAKNGELYAYKHEGFWKCMDTLRDKIQLNKMWDENRTPWKIW